MQIIDKSCIFFLVKNDAHHLKRFELCLDLLNNNFLKKYPYPVVLGHEGIDNNILNYFKSRIISKTYFYKLNFNLNDYSKEIISKIPEKFKGHWDEHAFFSIGYRHMCRLFSGEIYKDSFFDNVNYLMRLDTDSFFNKELSFDLFKYMQDNDLIYATFRENKDLDYVCEGLFDCVKDFLNINNIDKELKCINYNGTVETHIEISNMKKIKNSDYMKMYDFIDKTGNIYIKRWGDANIKYFGMKLFFDKQSCFLEDKNIGYSHGATQ